MKKHTLSKIIGGTMLFGAFLSPTFALETSNSSSVVINNDGLVKVMNAEVTSVSGNIINALVRFKNTLTNLTVTTNASTTVKSGNTTSNNTTSITTGDRIDVVGSLTSLGSTINVDASKIVDVTGTVSTKTYSGTVKSVNASNGTFVVVSGDKTFTVQTNGNTSFKTNSGTTTTTFTLATLPVNTKVTVTGTLSGGTLTATTVTTGKVAVKSKEDSHGATHGLKNGWKDKEDRTNNGEHKGFLKFNLKSFFGH